MIKASHSPPASPSPPWDPRKFFSCILCISECSTEWTQYESHCYKAFQEETTWDDAREQCVVLRSDLVSITSSAENSFINTTFLLDKKAKVWIGLNDREKEDEFQWSDGTPFKFSIFSATDISHGRSTNCVSIKNGEWYDQLCASLKPYICKKRGEKRLS